MASQGDLGSSESKCVTGFARRWQTAGCKWFMTVDRDGCSRREKHRMAPETSLPRNLVAQPAYEVSSPKILIGKNALFRVLCPPLHAGRPGL